MAFNGPEVMLVARSHARRLRRMWTDCHDDGAMGDSTRETAPGRQHPGDSTRESAERERLAGKRWDALRRHPDRGRPVLHRVAIASIRAA